MDYLKLTGTWSDQIKNTLSHYYKQMKSIHWMNEKPPSHLPYSPTRIEHLANILTHGLLVVPTFYLSICLVNAADNALEYWAALVYGFVLTGLFTVSTVFHTVAAFSSNRLWRNIFHRMDRAMIYIFIAGSYTPWLHLKSLSGISSELRWAVWVLATLGILYQQIFHEMYKALETFFYVVIALLPSLAVFEMDDLGGLYELKVGGVIYMTGVVFFKCDGVVPLAHAIWHVHVVFGALIHYYAVSAYLIVEEV